MDLYSEKQIESYNESNKRINIWVGAVRSGKTFSSLRRLVHLLYNGPEGDVMIVGVSRDSIQRNILNELYTKFLGINPPGSKTIISKLCGRNIYFIGAHDEGTVRKIQGSTLALAYIDEATCIPQRFFEMLLSRLSIKDAQLLATCNPDGPAHWLKKNYIDRAELDIVHWHFSLDDNPSLDKKYKEELKKEYVGMWYKRYILGEWAAAHGLIYDGFCDDNIYVYQQNNPNYYVVGVDYGTTNATAAVMCAITPKLWPQIQITDEYYYDSAKRGRSKTDAELADDIKDFCSWRPIQALYIDPAAASLKLELRRRDLPVIDAKNDVLTGIKITSKFISQKNIVIHKSCKTLIEQIQTYAWDPKAADRGEDKPLKRSDHICLTGEMEVWSDGVLSTMEEMVKNNYLFTQNTIAYWGGKFVESSYGGGKKTGRNKKILKLTLENGKFLRATPDHQVFTRRGYIEVQSLLYTDEVLCYR